MKKKVITTSLLTLLLTFSFSATAFADEIRNEIVYTNAEATAYTQPSDSAYTFGTVPAGLPIQRVSILDSGWSGIDWNARTCYIKTKYIDAPDVSQYETKTFSNAVTFVHRGETPNGLKIWYLPSDTHTWDDYLIAAYDATGITNDMSDYDKAVAINNYLCNVLEYDYDAVETHEPASSYYYFCLPTGKAVCQGYATAFNTLCRMAGVYSNLVHGNVTSSDEGHAWNYVLIGDIKYWVDVCWNDTSDNAYLMAASPFSDHIYMFENSN